MILKIYSIFDSKAENFGLPQFFVNDEVAVRNFSMFMESIKSEAFRSDYSLVCSGAFNVQTGVLTPCEKYVVIDGSKYVTTTKKKVSAKKSEVIS